ncbi:MAG: hypothetical protein AAFU50_01580 [Pseudomonadota bacterium]
MSTVTPDGRGFRDTVKSDASELKSRAQDEAEHRASRAKDQAASTGKQAADVIRDTARSMDQQDFGQAGDYVRRFADSVDRISDDVRDRSVSELLETLQDTARRQPALFIGGAVLLGFAATRFLKSSEPDDSYDDDDDDEGLFDRHASDTRYASDRSFGSSDTSTSTSPYAAASTNPGVDR